MNTDKRFGFMDYVSLVLLSFRRFFWSIDERDALRSKTFDFGMKFIIFLVEITFIWEILMYPVRVVFLIFRLVTLHPEAFSQLIRATVYTILYICVFFNIDRLKYNLHYKKSAWWKNTGCTPNEIRKDKSKGLYGEYIATLYAEKSLKTNNADGKILNNVFVPTPDGSFNEIDIISISEAGIQVIEAKGRQGKFSGSWLDDNISQNGNEMKNPLIQNLNHCNYLVNYLYHNLPLPDCEFKLYIDLFAYIKNVVLFSVYGIQDDMSRSFKPNMDAFVGMSDKYAKYKFSKDMLTKEQVNLIYKALLPLASYSPEERRQMIQQRELENQKKQQLREQQMRTHTYKPNTVYYIVDMNFIDIDGKWYRGNMVCKERNCGMDENREAIFYRTFYDTSDGWYYAKPNMTFNKRLTEPDYSEAKVIDLYNRQYKTPFLEK